MNDFLIGACNFTGGDTNQENQESQSKREREQATTEVHRDSH